MRCNVLLVSIMMIGLLGQVCASGADLLLNGGFELWTSGKPDNWGAGLDGYITISQDTKNVHSGSSSINLTWLQGNASGDINATLLSRPIKVATGEYYELKASVDYQTGGSDTFSMFIWVIGTDAAGNYIGPANPYLPVPPTWSSPTKGYVQKTYAFVANPADYTGPTYTHVIVSVGNAGPWKKPVNQGTRAYIDDLVLIHHPQSGLVHYPVAEAGDDVATSLNEVTLDGSRSSDLDGKIVSYVWKLGDTQVNTDTTDPRVTVNILNGSTQVYTLTVEDNEGFTSSDCVKVVNVPERRKNESE